jgi:hypothetical protein
VDVDPGVSEAQQIHNRPRCESLGKTQLLRHLMSEEFGQLHVAASILQIRYCGISLSGFHSHLLHTLLFSLYEYVINYLEPRSLRTAVFQLTEPRNVWAEQPPA